MSQLEAPKQVPIRSAFQALFTAARRDITTDIARAAEDAGRLVFKDLDKAEDLLKGILKKGELGKGTPQLANDIDEKIKAAKFPVPDQTLLLRFLPQTDASPKPETDQPHPVTQIFNEVRSDMLSEVTSHTNEGREAYLQGQNEKGQEAIEKGLSLLEKSRGIDDLAAEIVALVNDRGYTLETGLLQRSAIMLSEELSPAVEPQVEATAPASLEEIPTPPVTDAQAAEPLAAEPALASEPEAPITAAETPAPAAQTQPEEAPAAPAPVEAAVPTETLATPEVDPSVLQIVLIGNEVIIGNKRNTITPAQAAILSRLETKGEDNKNVKGALVLGKDIYTTGDLTYQFKKDLEPLKEILKKLAGRDVVLTFFGRYGGSALDKAVVIRPETAPQAAALTPIAIAVETPAPSPTTPETGPVTPEAAPEAEEASKELFKLVLEGGVLIVGETRLPLNNFDKLTLSRLAEQTGGYATENDLQPGFRGQTEDSIAEYMYRFMGRVNKAAGRRVIKRVGSGWTFDDAEYVQPAVSEDKTPSRRKRREKSPASNNPASQTIDKKTEGSLERAKTDISETDDSLLRNLFSFVEQGEVYSYSTIRSAIAESHHLDPTADAERIRNLEVQLTHGGLRNLVSLIERGRGIRDSGQAGGFEYLVDLVNFIDGLVYKGRHIYRDQHTGSLLQVISRDKSFMGYAHDVVTNPQTGKGMGGSQRGPKRNGGRRNI